MTNSYDNIIIGAGHNGLVCAAYLAKAGKKVLVLERADQVGGAAITRDFADGFRVSACAHVLHMLRPSVVRDLNLESHGLDMSQPGIATISLDAEGNHTTIGRDSLDGANVSDEDKTAYRDFVKRMEGHAKVLAKQYMKTPPRLASIGLKNSLKLAGLGWDLRFGLGKKKMEDLMRIVTMNIHHLLDESLDNEALKGALSFYAVLGTSLDQRMQTSVFTYLHHVAGGLDTKAVLPKGGMGGVSDALAASAQSFGAEIRTGAAVDHVLLDGGEAVGVVLSGGEEIRAKTVVSNADPRTTFFKLVGARHLEAGFAHRLGNLRNTGRVAKVHIALNGVPDFKGLETSALGNRLLISPSRKYLDNAYNHSKYGEFSAAPAMEITMPTMADASLAPDGQHVLSAIVQYAPYELKAGWDDSQKAAFTDRVIDALAVYAPGIRDQVVATECLTPADIEQEFGITGGHWHHVELALDQMLMMRPVHGTAQYKTPIEGLYLCGAGAHPGGGVMGAAGHNAAQEILAGDK